MRSMAWSRGRCRSGRRGRCRCWLHLECTDITATVHHAIKTRTALIIVGRPRVDSRAAGQQRVSKGGAAVVLQRAEHRSRVDLIARAGQESAAIVTTQIVAVRNDGACTTNNNIIIINNIGTCSARVQDSLADCQRRATREKGVNVRGVVEDAAADVG